MFVPVMGTNYTNPYLMEQLLRIISLRTIRKFWQESEHTDSEQPLKSWYAIAKHADWGRPQDVRDQFGSASIVGDSRVVFNIAGNKYRLIVKFNYPHRIGYVRFVGTHTQYDAVNVETV